MMGTTLNISYEETGAYLKASVEEHLSLQKNLVSYNQITAFAKDCGAKKVLIDLRDSRSNLGSSEGFFIGKFCGRLWRDLEGVAIVEKPERLDIYFESVATNFGARVKMYTEEHHAEEWLAQLSHPETATQVLEPGEGHGAAKAMGKTST